MKKASLLIPLTIILVLMSTTVVKAKPFYEGKVIKIIVATKPGGGYDYYARLMAPFLQKYLPGSTVIVKNMPGAGHVIGTNATYLGKPDGLTIGTFNRAVGMTQVAAMKGVKFDFSKFKWLGSPSEETYCLIVNSDAFKNIDDVLKAENLRMATSGVGTVAYVTTILFYQMLGQKNYSIGTGYAGGEVELAIMRKEMDGNFGSFDSRKSMVESGYGRFILFIGKTKPAGYENVPFIQDILTDPKHKPVIALLNGLNTVGRPFAVQPDLPEDRLKVLQNAFKKAVQDPELLKVAKKADRPVEFVTPEECEAWAKSLLQLPPDIVDAIKNAYKSN